MKTDDPSEALRQIVRWADAYSQEVYEPMTDADLKRASAALAGVGISLSALHARWARVLVADMGRLAREGLAAAHEAKFVH